MHWITLLKPVEVTSGSVKPQLSGLVGSGLNDADNQEFGQSKT